MKPKRTKTIGIIGCGTRGTQHVVALRKAGANIVGAVVRNPDSKLRVSRKLSIPAFETAEQLLEICSPDAIVIASPNYTHAPYAIASLEAGCHVLCEKPMATNRHDAHKMWQSAADANKCLMLAHNLRFAPPTRLAADLCAEGRLGQVYHVKCGWIRNRGIPGLGKWFTTERLAGGGALIDLGIHMLDMAWFILGKPTPISVSGSTHSLFADNAEKYRYKHMWAGPPDPAGKMDVEDFCTAFVRFEEGSTLQLEVAWAANAPQLDRYCVILGREGGIAWSERKGLACFDADGNRTVFHTQSSVFPLPFGQRKTAWLVKRLLRGKERPEKNPGSLSRFPTLHQHFLDCLDGADCLSPGSDGYIVQCIVDAIYESAKASREVPVALSQPTGNDNSQRGFKKSPGC